jgi:hypothetical protein
MNKFAPQVKIADLKPLEKKIVNLIIQYKAEAMYKNIPRFHEMGLEHVYEVLEEWLDSGEAKLIHNEDDETLDIKFYNPVTDEYDL